MQSTWRSAALAWQSSRACGFHPSACSRAHAGLSAGFSRSFSMAVPAAAAAAAEVVTPSVRGNVVRRLYERYPNLAPMLSGICLYVASDLLAASVEASYTSSSETTDEHPMSQLSRTLGACASENLPGHGCVDAVFGVHVHVPDDRVSHAVREHSRHGPAGEAKHTGRETRPRLP
mmetsp:Transcript_118298/g.379138  ORF Transcript_118298/g.379138 Transcript_118298/m.379138 type:complete len:175 (+) Transcript_118298:160-684(+)